MSVYFIRPSGASGPVKIGYSQEPASRLAALMIGSPMPLEIAAFVRGDEALERKLHRLFHGSRLHGEWFAWTPALGDVIASANDGTLCIDSLFPAPETKTHSDIAKAAGDKRLQEATGASIHTVRSWILRGRITPEHWAALARAEIASLEELADAAEKNPRKSPVANEQAAA